jgi:hypothetical protein
LFHDLQEVFLGGAFTHLQPVEGFFANLSFSQKGRKLRGVPPTFSRSHQMNNDYFASHFVSLALSWFFCFPVLFGIAGLIVSMLKKQEGVPWVFSAWVAVCFLWLSPIRYMLFQIVTATSYPFQSWFAFGSIFYLGIFILVPLAFTILFVVGFSLPLFLVYLISGGEKPHWWRYALASISAPLLALLGSMLFGLLLPIAAGLTTHHLRGEDIIRATNGPAYYVFAYLVADIERVDVPKYFRLTPRSPEDYLRTHVASFYLSDSEHKEFLEKAYPEIVTQVETDQ